MDSFSKKGYTPAVTIEGKKDILGIWIGEAESSKFWMSVLADLKNRGVKDLLICSVDGLKGFEDAIKASFPKAEIQKCVVHQIRNSTKSVSYTHLRAHETRHDLVCRLLLEKKKKKKKKITSND